MNQYEYWKKESQDNIETSKILIEKENFLDATFFCNLACEKILKAVYSMKTGMIPPKTHNLISLAKQSSIYDQLSKEYINFLNRVEVFQIEGRYPTNREKLYNSTPKDVFYEVLSESEGFVQWIIMNILK